MLTLIEQQIFKDFTSLDYIARFNGTPTIKSESVSQHSYWVTLFARLIAENITLIPDYKFILDTVDAAMFHDFEETFTGDILFDFKHNQSTGDSVVKLIEKFVDESMIEQYPGRDNCVNKHIQRSMVLTEIRLIKSIVKVADWLACLKYEYQEICLGNKSFNSILIKSLEEYNTAINKLKYEARNHLKDNINEGFFITLNTNLTYECFFA